MRKKSGRPLQLARHLECCNGGLEQHPPNPLAAMRRIDDDVVQHAGRTAKRHPVVSFDASVGVAEDLAVPLRNEDDDIGRIKLRPEIRCIPLLRPRRRGDEALRIEVVMETDDHCAEPPYRREIGGRRRANDDRGFFRQWHSGVVLDNAVAQPENVVVATLDRFEREATWCDVVAVDVE